MITTKKIEVFECHCDNCGVKLANSDFRHNEDMINHVEVFSDWHTEGDHHYCPECTQFDDAGSLMIIPPNYEAEVLKIMPSCIVKRSDFDGYWVKERFGQWSFAAHKTIDAAWRSAYFTLKQEGKL